MDRKKSFPKSTKLALNSYIGESKYKRFFVFFYFLMSKYKVQNLTECKKECENLFIISHEKIIRKDHIQMFNILFEKNIKQDNSVKIEYKRVFNFSLLRIFKQLIESKGDIFKISQFQMNEVTEKIKYKNIKNLIVFCDTAPLQSFIVSFFNKKNVKTLSLQHGFYPEIDNKYWNRIYMATNAKYFAAWDEVTINLIKNNSSNKKKFLKVGPINIHKKNINKNKGKEINKIAIYSVGKDQMIINDYLIDFYKFLKIETKIKPFFICHPRFNTVDRFFNSLKSGVKFRNNKYKYKNYDFHIVINSSVWLELENNNEKYLRLDELYKNKESYMEILNRINSFEKTKMKKSNVRTPFTTSEKGILEIVKFLKNEYV